MVHQHNMTNSTTYQPQASLKDKVCLISGASRALGAEIARRFATYGAHVAVNYHRSQDDARALCQELGAAGVRAISLQADVSQAEDAERLVHQTRQQLGPIDILVNNVGPYIDTPFINLAVADFDRILAGNIRATFLLSQLVGRQMKEQKRGHIINIAATDTFHRSHSIYGLAKSGVIHFTEAMALDLAPEVTINAVAPDLIADNEDMTSAEFVEQAIVATPLQKLVTRAEIAEMVCFMCTPLFQSVTGQTIVMDGGRSIARIANG